MAGAGKFISLCQKNNIKPIVGLHLNVESYELILLAKNFFGYQELSRLASLLNKKPIKFKDIKKIDLFIIDHPTNGYFHKNHKLLSQNNYFIPKSIDDSLANNVYANIVTALDKNDEKTLDILQYIKSYKTAEFVLPILEFKDNDVTALQNKKIFNEINIEFPKKIQWLPKFKNSQNMSSSKYLEDILTKNFRKIMGEIPNKNVYIDRLKYEFRIIKQLRFEDYFLIIADLINWAKKQKILIGPGRGSAAGSLVSYLLNITEIDPIKHNLMFERFLNPARVTMPDIDIDIQDDRRSEVVDYLFKKYDSGAVALISTFQRIKAKMAIRDIGRYLNVPQWEIDELAKAIPDNYSLEQAFKESLAFKSKIRKSKKNEEIYLLSRKIEGFIRQKGTHAAGIVISSGAIEEKVPTIINLDGKLQTQYTMNQIENFGLLKIDLLGLKNLQIIQMIQKEIFKNYKKKVNLKAIPFNDKATLDLLSRADSNGIFQLESYGMKKTLKEIQINSFDDLVAIISLYRPGPMEFIPLYAKRKCQNEKWESISKEYDEIVKNTYGIIIYQEQIMEIAKKIAKMTLAEADLLRYAIGKKKEKLIKELRVKFFKGAKSNGYSDEVIIKIYRQIEKFASYGFNKSHAVSYATLAYWLAYLKKKFPFEFYTSLLNASKGSQVLIKRYVQEIKSKNYKIISPEINISDTNVKNVASTIVLPFTIIKGVGESFANKIMKERDKSGPFKNFFKTIARLLFIGIGESNIESLIKANVFRHMGNISSLLDTLPIAVRYASMITKKINGEKVLEFKSLPEPIIIKSKRNVQQEIEFEMRLFGFNLSVFPSSQYELKEKIVSIQTNQTKEIVVHINNIKEIKDKNGHEMGIITLSDSSKTIDAFAFYEIWKFLSNTKVGSIVKVQLRKKAYKGSSSYTVINRWKVINEK